MFLFTEKFATKGPNELCAASIVTEIEIIYPIPKQSMVPIDRCFPLIEKNRLQHEKVNTPEYYVKLIAFARIIKLFDTVFLKHPLFTPGKAIAGEIPVLRVRDFKKMYRTKIKFSIPGISKCRSVIFSATSKPKIRESMGGMHNEFSLYKIGNQRLTGELLPDLPNKRFIKIKDKKLENINFLVTHVEQESDQEFYKILSDPSAEKFKGDNVLESDAEEY
ncbi:hypothetical protein ILUMI_15946 [Ignelater luminosus]|uniref:Uncharacterized protein n=1 Tax=Ignelater luminosus TaxID=2038154 RepID=A0A8K0CTU5_IGNLU|nr:hypothetical protein ILUMI_15946 [Ignelater luminosus]